jgi:hypothetical protein
LLVHLISAARLSARPFGGSSNISTNTNPEQHRSARVRLSAMIKHLSWYHDVTEEEAVRHTMSKPSMADILQIFHRLDGEEYPSLTLALDEQGERFPKLLIYGGAAGYAISLSQGDDQGNCAFDMLSYVNPDTRDVPASCFRSVGRSYPGCEIAERHFTSDAELVLSIIGHFAETGDWKSEVPFTVEREDDDGLIRTYDRILGENDEYAAPH